MLKSFGGTARIRRTFGTIRPTQVVEETQQHQLIRRRGTSPIVIEMTQEISSGSNWEQQ